MRTAVNAHKIVEFETGDRGGTLGAPSYKKIEQHHAYSAVKIDPTGKFVSVRDPNLPDDAAEYRWVPLSLLRLYFVTVMIQ